jgi:DNA-binding NarL/FixJ family response regulator
VPGDGLETGEGSPSIHVRVAPAVRVAGGHRLSPDQVRVLVLYSHPLMGEGLERMLAAEPGVVVDAVDIADTEAVNRAIASEPEVIVVEEGGAVDAADVVRRSHAALVMDVDITTTSAWTLRRESLSTRPDDFLAAIRAAIGGAKRGDPDHGLQPAVIPG